MSEEFKIVRRGYSSKLKEIEPYVTALEQENAKLKAEMARYKTVLNRISNISLTHKECADDVYRQMVPILEEALLDAHEGKE